MTTSARFNANGDQLYRNSTPYNSKAAYTVLFWHKPASFGGSGGYQTILIAYRGADAGWDAIYTTNAGDLYVDVNGTTADTGVNLSTSIWKYIGLRRTATSVLEVLVDGTVVYTSTVNIASDGSAASFYFGSEPYSTWSDSNVA